MKLALVSGIQVFPLTVVHILINTCLCISYFLRTSYWLQIALDMQILKTFGTSPRKRPPIYVWNCALFPCTLTKMRYFFSAIIHQFNTCKLHWLILICISFFKCSDGHLGKQMILVSYAANFGLKHKSVSLIQEVLCFWECERLLPPRCHCIDNCFVWACHRVWLWTRKCFVFL